MNRKLNLREKLDFNDIDLTAPEIIVSDILEQLSEESGGIILGKITEYTGRVLSYTQKSFSGIAEALGTVDKTVDIQKSLGALGTETHKFECFLFTPEFEKYKYRVFFMKYGIANYPVDVILDDSVAKSTSGIGSGYIVTCNSVDELEKLIYDIFSSKRLINVMQELIRINQSKKASKSKTDVDVVEVTD